MSIITDVKCARCDRKYSGLRSRCPYCGARRIGRGKYSEQSDDSKGKMLIGILIMAVLVVAVCVLLFTTKTPDEADSNDPVIEDTTSPSGGIISDPTNDINAEDNPTTIPPTLDVSVDDPTDSPSSQAPPISSVTITYTNSKATDFTVKVNDRIPLKLKIEPVGVDAEIIWESSNSSVFDIIDISPDRTSATVIGLSPGVEEKLTVTVGDVVETCIVRVSGRS